MVNKKNESEIPTKMIKPQKLKLVLSDGGFIIFQDEAGYMFSLERGINDQRPYFRFIEISY